MGSDEEFENFDTIFDLDAGIEQGGFANTEEINTTTTMTMVNAFCKSIIMPDRTMTTESVINGCFRHNVVTDIHMKI